ncbi:VWA domain-containing protein [Kordia sp. YSTF-M3]|uniref:VWA domain-containing protein n=1 Tax=Kordia aestuariivivens TaxID=2759037 RepID=A0ABR7Q3L0_9FLAO|nr:vWA domain-containing protein [Kordia aestuariivivens]MBC8753108.1 VWA domain-containing protein [Kordia aestuariivivens]
MKKLNVILASALLLTMACKGNSKTDTALLNETKIEIVTDSGILKSKKPNTIKVTLLLDTSNSMDGLIHQAKAQLWEIINELSYAKCDGEKPNLEIALYEYGNDNLPSSEGHIRQVLAFSSDLDEISEKLFSLTTRGGNEFCGHVIQTSIDQLNWGNNPKDLKLLFIAGNEPFTQGKVSYKDAITNATEKDVVINTIFCGNYEQGISGMWKDGAILGKGDYMTIAHTQTIVYIKTPYDQKIMEYNTRLNKTYIAYGRQGSAKFAKQATQDFNANSINEEIAVDRAVSKSSSFYTNSSWDLVDGIANDSVKLDELSKDELPKELKGKSKEQILAYVKKQQEERKKIQREIRELDTQRKLYIAKQSKDDSKTDLESAMIKAIKTQAARKNYTW